MRPRSVLVVMIVSFVFVVVSCSSSSTPSDEQPATTSTTSTMPASTTSTPAAGGLVSAAEATLAAWNESAVAFAARFVPTGSYMGVPISEVEATNSLGFYIGLGDRLEIHECAETSPRSVECTVTGVDELSGTQGYSFEGAAWMVLDDDGMVVTYGWNSTEDGGKISYTGEMVDWVRDTHPDIFEQSFADDTCTPERLDCWGDWAETPEAANELLTLHPEYLTSS